jgi:AcrR family transcriptional regulator
MDSAHYTADMTGTLPSAAAADEDLGLRARKKQQTRALIADAATELFAQHGFASVTVEQIARRAGVARQTVFNYFATKEEMLFDREQEVLESLLGALRERPPAATPLDVFRAHTNSFWNGIKARSHGPPPTEFWRLVGSNPALRDHAEIVVARHARAIGVALAQERDLPDDDLPLQTVARALCAVNSAVLTRGLDRIAAGEKPSAVAEEMLREADRAYTVLEHGLTPSA